MTWLGLGLLQPVFILWCSRFSTRTVYKHKTAAQQRIFSPGNQGLMMDKTSCRQVLWLLDLNVAITCSQQHKHSIWHTIWCIQCEYKTELQGVSKKLSTLQDTWTLSCTRFLAGFFRQEGIFTHHFYQGFRNRWPFVIWTNMLGVIDPHSYHI